MIEPLRAPVKPRVLSTSGESLPLVDEILSLIEAGKAGEVRIVGAAGSGKSTALAHLAAVIPAGAAVVLLDEPDHSAARVNELDHLVVYTTSNKAAEASSVITFSLAPWGRDEVIEYLYARHKDRCAAVLACLKEDDFQSFGGAPDLWRIVLDQLAAEPALADARTALHRYLQSQLQDTDTLERTRSACLNGLLRADEDQASQLKHRSLSGLGKSVVRVLRHREVQLLLATERVVADLRGEASCDFLAKRLPRELLQGVAREIKDDQRVRERLESFLVVGAPWSHAMAASLLHAAYPPWVPRPGFVPSLVGAYLDGVQWLGVQLPGVDLRNADLHDADLQGIDLKGAFVGEASFRNARLHGACLDRVAGFRADFSYADLSAIHAADARLVEAELEGARLDDAFLEDTSFRFADLTRASLRRAKLAKTIFLNAVLAEADFSEADLSQAVLEGVKLSEANFKGARFVAAHLKNSDLEYLDLGPADFEHARLRGALLTGSTAPQANFSNTDLRETGLAEIEWEGANLRGADLRGATFHMGTTRSGLVGSPIASEGSRTGFYTDDYDDRYFKDAEEIRKANLRGADLREACIDGVDFYLVDLRDALYDPEQGEHFRRCGAILEARV